MSSRDAKSGRPDKWPRGLPQPAGIPVAKREAWGRQSEPGPSASLLLRSWCMLGCSFLFHSGCASTEQGLTDALCRPLRLCCDDYRCKCAPDVCVPSREACCDVYEQKCLPFICLPQPRFACDDFCGKALPDTCHIGCTRASHCDKQQCSQCEHVGNNQSP